MFKAIKENNVKDSFLCIEEVGEQQNECEKDSLELNMIRQNNIEGFCGFYTRNIDKKQQFIYNITGMASLKSKYANREMGKEEIKNLIKALRSAFENTEEYFLNKGHILLEPEYIFAETTGAGVSFCYYPYQDKEMKVCIRRLAEFLISVTDHSQEDAINLSYGFYSQVTLEDYNFDKLITDTEQKENAVEEEDTSILSQREIYKPEEERFVIKKENDSKHSGPSHPILTTILMMVGIICIMVILLLIKLY